MKINRFRMFLFKFFSLLLIVSSLLVIGRNFYILSSSLGNTIKYFSFEDIYIKIISIIRELLKILTIIFGLFLIKRSFNVILLKKDTFRDDLYLGKIKKHFTFLLLCSFIIQVLSLSDLYTNIIMMICIVLLFLVQVLLTNNRIIRFINFLLFNCYVFGVAFIFSYSYLYCHYNEGNSNKTGISNISDNYFYRFNQIWKMSSNSLFYHGVFYDKNINNNYSMIRIPGLSYTDTLDVLTDKVDTCASITPQGIAVTDKYIFISSYCHTHKHNSVIYMLDKKNRKLIKHIVLDDLTHAGGLAYDDVHEMLFIATNKSASVSDNEGGDEATVSSLKLEDIMNYNFYESNAPITYHQTFKTAFKSTSFLTYHDGYLYTGYFQGEKEDLSLAGKFKINDDGEIITNFTPEFMFIPGRVQSLAFMEDKILFTISYGLEQSLIKIYDYDSNNVNYYDIKPYKTITTPQMLEQIYPYDGQLYLLFESASFSYKYTAPISMEYVVSIKDGYLFN